ncbi:putative CNB1-calcineurin B, regulatory subunit [Histomonas meleagridis]|uniref:putative CNB1-calcineurin B, regulatory subunit n=1 Tax=Histomonas meleagridis TaxID=135588 RepID=UPI003559C5E8|nr:putative CNB1-calcineurin B, regulatory subunit [Histomonas meleagridis]KAH0798781.1 putative CNB1-calcineurin B, regulatory subunit [Histomonas meleagridis]
MGGQGSQIKLKKVKLTRKLITELASSSHFSEAEIKILYDRFQVLVKEHKHKGGINVADFMDILGMSSVQLTEYIFAAFDRNGDKTIDFPEYIHGLSPLCDRADASEKVEFLFHVFDMDKDGLIKIDKFKEIMAVVVKERSTYVPDEQVSILVDSTIRTIDPEGKGVVDFKQWKESVSNYPFLLNFASIDLKLLLSPKQ